MVGKTLQNVLKEVAVSGNIVDTSNYYSYVSILLIFIISLVYLYNSKTSLFAIFMLYLTNIIYSIVLSKDIFKSPKANDSAFITIIIAFALFSNVCSTTVVMNALRKLHNIYSKNKEQIKLSEKNRNILSLYVTIWIASLFIISILMSFFFIESVDEPFFNYMFIGKQLSPPFMVLGFVLKVVGTAALTILNLYMIYLSFRVHRMHSNIVQ